jgi:hypothetical protein
MKLCPSGSVLFWRDWFLARPDLPAPRRDQSSAEFLANREDLDVQKIGQGIVVLIDEMFIEFRSRHDLAAMESKVLKNAKLACRQADGFPPALVTVRERVSSEYRPAGSPVPHVPPCGE